MGLITLNLKRVLNWNFIFMSAVAAIFGMISLMNFGDISENIVFGVDIKYFMLDGYLCLFIFFAGEISKDMLQQEKITKRILCKQIAKTSIIERLHQNNKEKPGAKLSLLPAFLYLLLYVVD